MPRNQRPKLPPAKLLKPQEEVTRILQFQVDRGRDLLETQINNQSDLEQARSAIGNWDARNKEYLGRHFDNRSKLEEYEGPAFALPAASASTSQPDLQEDVRRFKEMGKELVCRLEKILFCVDIIDEAPGVRPAIVTAERSIDLLTQLRRGLSSDQREMLNAIWAYYVENGNWISCRRLHSQFQERPKVSEVRAVLADLSGSVVYETIDDCYALKFLGIMLADAGPKYEELCVSYLGYARKLFQENPDVRVVIGREVQAAFDLSPHDSRLLGQIIALGPLSGGSFSGAGTPDWSAGVPRDIDSLYEWEDLRLYLHREVVKDYDKSMPITQHGLAEYWLSRTRLPSDLFPDLVPTAQVGPEANELSAAPARVDNVHPVPGSPDPKSSAAAFLSYTHFDDEQNRGQLTILRKHLAAEVRTHTGQPFVIFQDRDSIGWGEQWEQRIDHVLSDEATLLIPIVTPSFFTSEPCRKELRLFLERERRLGRNDLIRPIYYVDCPGLNRTSDQEGDELVKVIASRQNTDWRKLRHSSLTTKAARTKLAELAVQIRDALGSI